MRKDERLLLQERLERIDRIEQFTADGREAYFRSLLVQDAVIRNFEVMGEIVKRLPSTLTSRHPEIPWKRLAGFRDVLIHDYESIRVELVWEAVAQLPALKAAIQALLQSP